MPHDAFPEGGRVTAAGDVRTAISDSASLGTRFAAAASAASPGTMPERSSAA